jgi:hypothetical protein
MCGPWWVLWAGHNRSPCAASAGAKTEAPATPATEVVGGRHSRPQQKCLHRGAPARAPSRAPPRAGGATLASRAPFALRARELRAERLALGLPLREPRGLASVLPLALRVGLGLGIEPVEPRGRGLRVALGLRVRDLDVATGGILPREEKRGLPRDDLDGRERREVDSGLASRSLEKFDLGNDLLARRRDRDDGLRERLRVRFVLLENCHFFLSGREFLAPPSNIRAPRRKLYFFDVESRAASVDARERESRSAPVYRARGRRRSRGPLAGRNRVAASGVVGPLRENGGGGISRRWSPRLICIHFKAHAFANFLRTT